MQAKKLIEVAMPIKEISAESVRDKSIRHGHISTLHLWWARRPLPVCRAVIFASLVPDPLDNNCPQIFKEAIDLLLGKNYNIGDPYKPYDDIPFTSAVDKMEDNLRNRLIMFIGKFSEKYIQNERIGKETSSKDQISTFSLIKSESKNDKNIISKARKLIWVNHNAKNESNLQNSLDNYDAHFNKILEIEKELYGLLDRHIITETVRQKEQELSRAIDAFLEKMPKTFDPFTGGGAIPLESARLGCKSYGNDINPVAHIIQKASLEFPQKFGKRLIYTKNEFIKKYGIEYLINWCKLNSRHYLDENLIIDIPNILSFDVKFYAEKILSNVEKLISDNYKVDLSKGELLAYYWVRFAICSNPSCKAEVPLLKQFYLSKVRGRSTNDWVYIKPVINNNKIEFTINKGICEIDGFVKRGSFVCPCCGNMTHEKDLKDQFKEKKIKVKAPIRKINYLKYAAAACLLPLAFYSFWIPTHSGVLESGLISFKDFNPFYKKEIGNYSQQKIDFPKNNNQEITIFEECIKERRNHRIGIYQFDEETNILVHLEKKITTKKVEEIQIEEIKDQEIEDILPEVVKIDFYEYIVGCYNDKKSAVNFIEKLKEEGFDAKLTLDKSLYRVSIGSAETDAEIQQIIRHADEKGYIGWILKK